MLLHRAVWDARLPAHGMPAVAGLKRGDELAPITIAEFRPAQDLASCARPFEASLGPLTDLFALELCERGQRGQEDVSDELAEVYDRLTRAERPTVEAKATTCCYAKSDKQWIADPQGVPWETFFTYGEATVYGEGSLARLREVTAQAGCCEPAAIMAAAPAAAPPHTCCAG
jgi:hypothetical protein